MIGEKAMNRIIQFLCSAVGNMRSISNKRNSLGTGFYNLQYYFVTPLQEKEARLISKALLVGFLVTFLMLQGCTSVNTLPKLARAGDTVSIMVGGTEKARKDTIQVTLTDINGLDWDLQALGKVRSVFNLRTDGRAEGMHYSPYLDSYISWSKGHEPVQAVLVTDIPAGVPAGLASLSINTAVDDNSSGIFNPFTVNLEIIAGIGSPDDFGSQGVGPVDFTRLEPAPHVKITFSGAAGNIGAASLIVDFDETVLNPDDINVYVPESTVRGSFVDPGAFGETQRMVYWHHDGLQLYVDIVAPQGIVANYLQLYVMHPNGLAGPVNLSLTSATIYDVDGNEIIAPPSMEYFP